MQRLIDEKGFDVVPLIDVTLLPGPSEEDESTAEIAAIPVR